MFEFNELLLGPCLLPPCFHVAGTTRRLRVVEPREEDAGELVQAEPLLNMMYYTIICYNSMLYDII